MSGLSSVRTILQRTTVPVGAPAPVKAGVTATVSTSVWPTATVVAEAVSVVVAATLLTCTWSTGDALAANADEPLYTAVRFSTGPNWNTVVNTARPALLRSAVPRKILPLERVL